MTIKRIFDLIYIDILENMYYENNSTSFIINRWSNVKPKPQRTDITWQIRVSGGTGVHNAEWCDDVAFYLYSIVYKTDSIPNSLYGTTHLILPFYYRTILWKLTTLRHTSPTTLIRRRRRVIPYEKAVEGRDAKSSECRRSFFIDQANNAIASSVAATCQSFYLVWIKREGLVLCVCVYVRMCVRAYVCMFIHEACAGKQKLAKPLEFNSLPHSFAVLIDYRVCMGRP